MLKIFKSLKQALIKQAQESLAAAMSLSDISGIGTSSADFYKNNTPTLNSYGRNFTI